MNCENKNQIGCDHFLTYSDATRQREDLRKQLGETTGEFMMCNNLLALREQNDLEVVKLAEQQHKIMQSKCDCEVKGYVPTTLLDLLNVVKNKLSVVAFFPVCSDSDIRILHGSEVPKNEEEIQYLLGVEKEIDLDFVDLNGIEFSIWHDFDAIEENTAAMKMLGSIYSQSLYGNVLFSSGEYGSLHGT